MRLEDVVSQRRSVAHLDHVTLASRKRTLEATHLAVNYRLQVSAFTPQKWRNISEVSMVVKIKQKITNSVWMLNNNGILLTLVNEQRSYEQKLVTKKFTKFITLFLVAGHSGN